MATLLFAFVLFGALEGRTGMSFVTLNALIVTKFCLSSRSHLIQGDLLKMQGIIVSQKQWCIGFKSLRLCGLKYLSGLIRSNLGDF